MIKQCKKCKTFFPETDEFFYKQIIHTKKKGDYYKLTPWCKTCKSKQSLQWQNNNPDKYSNNKKEWYLKNEEFQQKQREKSKKPEMRLAQKNWRIKNPGKLKEYRDFRYMHKKHLITNIEWNICKNYFENSCAYCGLQQKDHYKFLRGKYIKTDLHKEHVEHSGSNEIDNCIPSCLHCNSSKYNKDLFCWFNVHNPNYTDERMERILMWLYYDWKHSKDT